MEDEGQVVSSCEVVLASLCNSVSPEEEDDGRRRRRSLENNFLVLIACARSSDGRQKLAEANAIPLLLPLLPEFARSFPSSLQQHQFHLFILLLKLLRNLCAGNGINQDSFLQCKGLETLAWIAHSLLESSPSTVLPPPHAAETLQMLLQVVANVAGRGELSLAVVWENFFPAIFGGMAEVLSQKVQEPLCMVLSTCCKGSKKSCMEILSSQGIPIIASILNAGTQYFEAPSCLLHVPCILGTHAVGIYDVKFCSLTACHVVFFISLSVYILDNLSFTLCFSSFQICRMVVALWLQEMNGWRC
jgi:hypothetical protein